MHLKRSKHMIGGLCLCALLAALPGPAWGQTTAAATETPADPLALLKAIPADATAFLAIRDLSEANKDIVDMARTLGFLLGPPPQGIFPAPLDWLKEQAGVTQGLNDNGGMAVVLLDCADAPSTDEMAARLVLLIPCSDGDTLVAALGGEKEGEVLTVDIMGQPYVAAIKGGFLVAGQSPEVVKAVLQSPKGGIHTAMSPDRVKAFANHDLFGWVTMRGISPQVRQEVISTFTGLAAMANPQGMGPDADAGQELMKFLDESQELSFGMAIDRRGLNLSGYFRGKPGTELGTQMAATKAPEGPMLLGLPNEPTVLSFGAVTSGGRGETQIRKLMDAILDENEPQEGVSSEQIKSLKDALVSILTGVERVSASVANLPPDAGQGLLAISAVLEVKDSRQWMEAAGKSFDLLKHVLLQAARAEELDVQAAQALADGIQWKPKAEQVGELQIDHVTLDLSRLPGVDETEMEQLTSLLGLQGVTIRVAAAGDRHVVVVFGAGSERLVALAEAARKGESPLSASDSIQKVATRLPEGARLLEGYLNLDQLLNTVTGAMMRVGQPMMFPLMMRNAAPLAFMVTRVDDTAQEVHLLVPMELVVSVRDAAMPLMQMMMMGGGQERSQMSMEFESEPAPVPSSEPR